MPLNVSAAIGPLSPLGTNGRYNKKEKKKEVEKTFRFAPLLVNLLFESFHVVT